MAVLELMQDNTTTASRNEDWRQSIQHVIVVVEIKLIVGRDRPFLYFSGSLKSSVHYCNGFRLVTGDLNFSFFYTSKK